MEIKENEMNNIDTEEATDMKACDDTESSANEDVKESRGEKKKCKKLENELAELQKKNDELNVKLSEEKDKYMRMLAEYDNYRRRTQKEKEGIYADAYSDAVSAVLPIIDNLERAAQFNNAEAVAKGVEMTLKAANESFEKMGVASTGAKGEKFNPELHNAVAHIEDEALDSEVIADVYQKGYTVGGKVIRYAMVSVAN